MRKKLAIAITSPISIVLLKGQLNYFSELGYEVILICPKNEKSEEFAVVENVKLIPVNFFREINLFHDLLCLFKLIKILWREKPDIVNAGTPKASLLTLIAAYVTGVNKRIYTCRGLRFEDESGAKKRLLIAMEKITAFCAHSIICISASVMKKAIDEKTFPKKKTLVLGKGSSNGIDLDYYNPTSITKIDNLHYKNNDTVFGFIGRFIERKGVNELVKSFVQISENKTKLLMVGGYDESQLPEDEVCNYIDNHEQIIKVGWVEDIRSYLKAIDVLVLPAYWEGFGNVLIQAAAFGIPVIATKVSGCMDAVKDGFNGTLIEPKDDVALAETMLLYLNNREIRDVHGKQGKVWVQNFRQELVWNEMHKFYEG